MEAFNSRRVLHPSSLTYGLTDTSAASAHSSAAPSRTAVHPPTHSTPLVNGRSRVPATDSGVKESRSTKSPGQGAKAKLLDRRVMADTSVAGSESRPNMAPLGADQTLLANLSSMSPFMGVDPSLADYWAWRSGGGVQTPNRAVAHVHVVGGPTFARFADTFLKPADLRAAVKTKFAIEDGVDLFATYAHRDAAVELVDDEDFVAFQSMARTLPSVNITVVVDSPDARQSRSAASGAVPPPNGTATVQPAAQSPDEEAAAALPLRNDEAAPPKTSSKRKPGPKAGASKTKKAAVADEQDTEEATTQPPKKKRRTNDEKEQFPAEQEAAPQGKPAATETSEADGAGAPAKRKRRTKVEMQKLREEQAAAKASKTASSTTPAQPDEPEAAAGDPESGAAAKKKKKSSKADLQKGRDAESSKDAAGSTVARPSVPAPVTESDQLADGATDSDAESAKGADSSKDFPNCGICSAKPYHAPDSCPTVREGVSAMKTRLKELKDLAQKKKKSERQAQKDLKALVKTASKKK